MILKAGLSILCIKEVSKKGFSISCTMSHHCVLAWERGKRWKVVSYLSAQTSNLCRKFFLALKYASILFLFNSFQLLCGVSRQNWIFHCLPRVPLIVPTLFAICQDPQCPIRPGLQLSFSSAARPESAYRSPLTAIDRGQSLWEPALSGTVLQMVHHCLVFLNMA